MNSPRKQIHLFILLHRSRLECIYFVHPRYLIKPQFFGVHVDIVLCNTPWAFVPLWFWIEATHDSRVGSVSEMHDWICNMFRCVGGGEVDTAGSADSLRVKMINEARFCRLVEYTSGRFVSSNPAGSLLLLWNTCWFLNPTRELKETLNSFCCIHFIYYSHKHIFSLVFKNMMMYRCIYNI